MNRFRFLLAAAVTSSLGNGMRWVALPLLAAGVSTDPRSVSLVTAAEQVPSLLFGLIAGVVADRSDRRRLTWTTNLARGLVMMAFTGVVLTQRGGIAVIAAVGFAITCADTFGGAAFAALVPELVPVTERARANSRLEIGYLIADPFVGSVLGAILFAAAAALPFAADALTFFVAAAIIARMPGRYRPRRHTSSTARAEAVEGIRFLLRSRPLGTLCGLLAFSQMVESSMVAILVLYARQVLGLGTVGYGLLIAVFAAGGVGGAVAAPRIAATIGDRSSLLAAIGVCAATALTMGLTGNIVIAGLAVALYGASTSLWNLVTVTVRQTLVPSDLMGRIVSAFRMVIFGVTPVGAIGGGLVAHAAGLRTPFLIGAAEFAVALTLAAWRLRLGDPVAGQAAISTS